MTIDHRIYDSIKGFMDPVEGKRLYDMALSASRMGPCLEIGSYCGKSAICIGSACRENNAVLFSIDHHRGSEEQQPGEEYFDPELFDEKTGAVDTLPHFRSALSRAGLNETVIPVIGFSHHVARMWATPLALVFIDGGHALETVLTDYNSWAGHIMAGGFLLIHDIFDNSKDGGQAPRQAYQLALSSGLFTEFPRTRTLGVLQRRHCGDVSGLMGSHDPSP